MNKKITSMTLTDVETQDGFTSFDVTWNELEYWFEGSYQETMTSDEFFFMACDYLEQTNEDVESTETAKIDYYC